MKPITYLLGRAVGQHPVIAAGLLVACATWLIWPSPEAPKADSTSPQWRAPADPADTPARRERRQKARDAEDMAGALKRMK